VTSPRLPSKITARSGCAPGRGAVGTAQETRAKCVFGYARVMLVAFSFRRVPDAFRGRPPQDPEDGQHGQNRRSWPGARENRARKSIALKIEPVIAGSIFSASAGNGVSENGQ
jgi:hypothetical protein